MYNPADINRMEQLKKDSMFEPDFIDLLNSIGLLQQKNYELLAEQKPTDMSPDAIHPSAFSQGTPLFQDNIIPFDEQNAELLFGQIITICADTPPLKEAAQQLLEAIDKGETSSQKLFSAISTENKKDLERMSFLCKQSPAFPYFCAFNAMLPSMKVLIAAQLSAKPLPEKWSYGHCPVCGGTPFMSSLEGDGGHRNLCCSRCHTTYGAIRMACAFCSGQEPDNLESFSVEEIPAFKVNVCNKCNSYIKTADFREYTKKSHPRIDDLESAALDMIAAEQGFVRTTRSGWGF